MSQLPNNIQVIFDENPQLATLLRYPSAVSDSSFVSAFCSELNRKLGNDDKDTLYKIVFKKDSSRELMSINSGELKGLFTTTCIEKGRFSDIAGLKEVTEIDKPNLSSLIPILLGISCYGAIQSKLSYISALCVDIRNHQVVEEQARFERITETIVDCFKSIPDISLDPAARQAYLNRVVSNNEDCHEMFIAQRLKLESDIKKFQNEQHPPPIDRFFNETVIKHPVFSVFERLVAGRICEIVLSGNYSESTIKRHFDFVTHARTKLDKVLNVFLKPLDDYTGRQERKIELDDDLTGWEIKELRTKLEDHRAYVQNMRSELNDKFESKLESFKILSSLREQEEIEIFILDGRLIVNNIESESTKALQ